MNSMVVLLVAAQAICVDTDTRERLRALQLEAINEAYKDSVKHLFEVWMRDPSGQPQRARVGITQATHAYIHARSASLNWAPLICP